MQTRSIALVAALALLALGVFTGGAVAGGLITGQQIKNGSIGPKDLGKGSVTSKAVKNGTLKAEDLAPGTRAQLAGSAPVRLQTEATPPSGGGTVVKQLGSVAGRPVSLLCEVYGAGYVTGRLVVDGPPVGYRIHNTRLVDDASPTLDTGTGTTSGPRVLADAGQVNAFDRVRVVGMTWLDVPGAPIRFDYDLVVLGHAEGRTRDLVGSATVVK